jgi:hypothetical protein
MDKNEKNRKLEFKREFLSWKGTYDR